MGFDTDEESNYWKINDYVVNDFSDDYEWSAENTEDSIYDTRNGRGIVTWNYDDPGESYHTKKRIDNIFVYNPYGEFDFRIVVSEKCYRDKTAKRTAKRKGKLVLTRDKERRIWYDENNGTEFKSSTVTETPAVNPERHEVEIELDIESVIGDLGDRDDTLCEDIEGYINNLIQEADAVNEGVS
ncbi:hypothetical protein Cantr_09038 [Candida viswanathii]|uniref:mRNA 5'-phosphatase n=1 Tax=Candida viswanathii TaxID=5486 RepID=A0A367YCE8_9ASCO|nr:hypothetical protein Cantr_09038 [Candida viswanathii]